VSKNYKRNSPLYFKKKLRRNVTQKFKPEEEADAIPLEEKRLAGRGALRRAQKG